MVEGANSCLESNPIPARDAQRAQKTLYTRRPRDSTETETELCLSLSCGGNPLNLFVHCHRDRALGTADLSMA